jgi:predicted phosphoadenosine phosphosulfate sulfurtransferase
MSKRYLDLDVFSAAVQRLETIFDNFERIYVSFSGGKDSGALVQLALEVARRKNRLPLDVLHVDLEAWYQHTADFVTRIMTRPDVRPHWVCLPIHLRNSVSQMQPHWLCWEPEAKAIWVREMPRLQGVINDEKHFSWFRRGMEFEEFVPLFGEEFSQGRSCACLVGIRSDESLNRFRTIKSLSKRRWKRRGWTTVLTSGVVNAYPIYDWRTKDVWIAHGRRQWDYNRIYDLMHKAGLSLPQMRLCQPFGDDQRRGLWLFKILEPETWTRLVGRVQGANFGNRYVARSGNVLGNYHIALPPGYTWQSYCEFLLSTMPASTAEHYRDKIKIFIHWWDRHGVSVIPDEADPRLEAAKKAPSWRRICKVLLKNDYWCKGLSFSQTKNQMERQLAWALRFLE